MDRATRLALNRINQRFYAAIADEWGDKRKHAWPGFARLWEICATTAAKTPGTLDGSLNVLDIGCGDGRFAQFMAEQADLFRPPSRVAYLGLDVSAALLQKADARKLGLNFRFVRADVVGAPLTQALGPQKFDLIVLLGVLHHIPGTQQRAELLRGLGQHLTPAGSLVVTVWRLDEDPRFESRTVPFERYNQSATEPIALDQLEPGDTLLWWGQAGGPARYCHFPEDAALRRMVADTGLRETARFRSDGSGERLNEYLILQRS